jgi:hypothetical protein
MFSYRKKRMEVVSNTPLYEKTKQKVDDFYAKIDKEELMPWGKLGTVTYYLFLASRPNLTPAIFLSTFSAISGICV